MIDLYKNVIERMWIKAIEADLTGQYRMQEMYTRLVEKVRF